MNDSDQPPILTATLDSVLAIHPAPVIVRHASGTEAWLASHTPTPRQATNRRGSRPDTTQQRDPSRRPRRSVPPVRQPE